MDKTVSIMEKDNRLEQICEQIVRLANANFTQPGEISEKGDDFDSIIIGLNLLGEELESYIVQLKESQQKNKNTLLQLTEVQKISHIGSWEWDVFNNKITWTEELYRIYGRDLETFKSDFENFLLCIHAEERDYVNNIIQKAFQEKTAFSFSIYSARYHRGVS